MRPTNYDGYYWQDDLVRLRAMEPDDWEVGYYNRFDTEGRRRLQYMVELPPTIDEAKAGTEQFVGFPPGTGRLMFTVETLDGLPVGGLNLNSIDERNGTFSVGMQIDRDHRGKGYGTAAMRILLRYAFHERRLNKYHGHVLDGNIASATMLRKLGCVEEGRRTQMVYTDGRYMDIVLFGLTRQEFDAANPAR